MAVYAIDLGGTRIKMGIVENGEVIISNTIEAKSREGLAARLDDIKNELNVLAVKSKISADNFTGVGLAFPSLVDNKTGQVFCDSAKYSDAENLNLNQWCKESFGLPFAIENDAKMALIGEWQSGAAKGFQNAVMITLGTGIGTAVLIEGRILRGAHGVAGNLGGHLIVNYNSKIKCSCGNLGCVEAESGTHYLPLIVKNYPQFNDSKLLNKLEYRNIFELAEESEPLAVALKNNALKIWAALSVNLIYAYDPKVLIFGGGIMKSAKIILPYLKEYINKHGKFCLGCPEIKSSELGDSAALLACEWLVQEKIKS